jgi:nicotinamidase-related amidase
MKTIPDSAEFLDYLAQWQAGLIACALPNPQRAAILVVDLTDGFCRSGALASPRAAGIISPIVTLLNSAWHSGLRSIALVNDNHDRQAVEFGQWPPHCVNGTAEVEPVSEIKALPFFKELAVLPKNSTSSAIGTGLEAWLDARPGIDTFIVTGDCTDLCIYQLAMHLRLSANAAGLARRVIIPADCVDTYDLPTADALQLGVLPHPGDLLHTVFLYHMALNGVEIIRSIR